ncbi:hypothetical protein HPB50_017398 [Hyalomma asiaticum]|uniref:Uncharacterized protein n=1 Tax=Hyalomma asiaticum TaxID=266040 RepID=A0ACB7S6Z1_HYAAI|nr:hypothetical protein HPB50_017398 [Hyalomma asiaticum]
MAADRTSRKPIIWKYLLHPPRTAIIGDSQTKYFYNHFNPSRTDAPMFVCQPGANIESVEEVIDFVPWGVSALTTSKRTTWKYPKSAVSTVVLGDSQTKYLFQYFDPLLQSTPAFVTLSGALISDVPSLVDLVPSSATTLILHVGSNDLTRRSALATFQRYRKLLDFIHEELPEIRCVYATLVLPRTTNRRRRNDNRAFVRRFKREASRFNSLLRSFCGRSRNLSCLDHMFEWLPPGRVLAADGVHLSFEGVALMASHIRQLCFSSPSEARRTGETANRPGPLRSTRRYLTQADG